MFDKFRCSFTKNGKHIAVPGTYCSKCGGKIQTQSTELSNMCFVRTFGIPFEELGFSYEDSNDWSDPLLIKAPRRSSCENIGVIVYNGCDCGYPETKDPFEKEEMIQGLKYTEHISLPMGGGYHMSCTACKNGTSKLTITGDDGTAIEVDMLYTTHPTLGTRGVGVQKYSKDEKNLYIHDVKNYTLRAEKWLGFDGDMHIFAASDTDLTTCDVKMWTYSFLGDMMGTPLVKLNT